MKETVKMVGDLMKLSARTAPKARGNDFVEVKIVEGEKLEQMAEEMLKYSKGTNKRSFYERNAKNLRETDAVFLISLNKAKTAGLDCGACGFDKCSELKLRKGPEFDGGICAWRLIDLGIALGSAVKTAGSLNVDNRIMYTVGVVAKRLGLIQGEIVVGVPLSATGKNIYFGG
ncbi:MAG TPA: hypothetical protein GX526_04080 [Thermoanaerobacterales bacterium]|nr:hypothetical protein [Thermoanaerobacterales bacterium]